MREPGHEPKNGRAPDDELVTRAQGGDREAFGVLWDRHHQRVYGYSYRRLNNKETAEDATAEVFRKALAALSNCRPPQFREWLFVIAHNVIVDALRTRRPTVPLETAVNLESVSPSPEDVAVQCGTFNEISELLVMLSTDQQDVITLRLAGLEPIEIAHVLNKSRAAVDMSFHRSLVRLRALMGIDPIVAGGN
jgi:RNA polymerase sigma-70 factor (ECF subfamily)